MVGTGVDVGVLARLDGVGVGAGVTVGSEVAVGCTVEVGVAVTTTVPPHPIANIPSTAIPISIFILLLL